jgi:hypothetical protein
MTEVRLSGPGVFSIKPTKEPSTRLFTQPCSDVVRLDLVATAGSAMQEAVLAWVALPRNP